MANEFDPTSYSYVTEANKLKRRRQIAEMLQQQAIQQGPEKFNSWESGAISGLGKIGQALIARNQRKNIGADEKINDANVAAYNQQQFDLASKSDAATARQILQDMQANTNDAGKLRAADLIAGLDRKDQRDYDAGVRTAGYEREDAVTAARNAEAERVRAAEAAERERIRQEDLKYRTGRDAADDRYRNLQLDLQRDQFAMTKGAKAEADAAAAEQKTKAKAQSASNLKEVLDTFTNNDISKRFGVGRVTSTLLPDWAGEANASEQRERDALQQMAGALRSNAKLAGEISSGELNQPTEVNAWIKGQMGDAVKIDDKGNLIPNVDVGWEEYDRRRNALLLKFKGAYKLNSGVDYETPKLVTSPEDKKEVTERRSRGGKVTMGDY